MTKLTELQAYKIDKALFGLQCVLTQIQLPHSDLRNEVEKDMQALEIIISDLQTFRANTC